MAGFVEDDGAIEHTLCQIRLIHVFKIPPRTTSGGHRAGDWKDEVWQGSLKVVQKGRECAIFLVDPKTGEYKAITDRKLVSGDCATPLVVAGALFAMCPVKEGAVERCVDSSRYFVLKIQNAQGRHAFIGVAFSEREESFDFNVALQEYEKDKEREEKIRNGTLADEMAAPSKDLSLKEGEKISIKLPPGATTRRRSPVPATGGAPQGGGLLAPPPRSGGLLAPPSAQQSRKPHGSSGGDLFGDLGSAPWHAYAPGPSSGPANAPSAPIDDFTSFMMSGSGPAQPSQQHQQIANSPAAAGAFDDWSLMGGALPTATGKPAPSGTPSSSASKGNDPFLDLLG